MSNLQTYYFELDFQKVDQHTGGKWLIHGTKRRKDNQLQRSKENMLNPIFKKNVQRKKHPGSCALAEPDLLM